MSTLKLKDIPGIGMVTEQTLNGLGVNTGGDINYFLAEIFVSYSETFFEFIVKASIGISRNYHEDRDSHLAKKSISLSRSFRSITRYEQFKDKIEEIAIDLAKKTDDD